VIGNGGLSLSKEANPLWGDIYNNRCSYFKSYSSHTLSLSKSGIRIGRGSGNGISYDLLNFGRPDANGNEQKRN
jgi:hypothetical protein